MSKKQGFAAFVSGGGAAGVGAATYLGNMGLAGAFGGVAIGAVPVVVTGMVVGGALYGVKSLFD